MSMIKQKHYKGLSIDIILRDQNELSTKYTLKITVKEKPIAKVIKKVIKKKEAKKIKIKPVNLNIVDITS